MVYSAEHLALAFATGLVLGVISTIFFTRRELTLEAIVSLLIMGIWLGMHMYGFFFDKGVPWVFDFAGFGAAGNFIGVSIQDLKGRASDLVDKVTKTKAK